MGSSLSSAAEASSTHQGEQHQIPYDSHVSLLFYQLAMEEEKEEEPEQEELVP